MKFLIPFSLVAAIAGPISQAATIVEYQTAPSSDSATISPSVSDAAVSGDSLATGGGLTSATGGTYNWSGWDTANTTFAAAVTAGDFWSWGFDVTADVTIDLTAMDIRLDRSGTGPDDFEIQVSVNGGTGISILTYDYADSGSGVDFVGIDLSSVPSLVQGDSVVFTMAAFNSEGSTGTFDLETVDFGGDDPRSIRITGTVPEPSAALLGACGLLGLFRRRR